MTALGAIEREMLGLSRFFSVDRVSSSDGTGESLDGVLISKTGVLASDV